MHSCMGLYGNLTWMGSFACYFWNGPKITEMRNFAREWRMFSYSQILLTCQLRWKHVKCKLEEWQMKQPTLNCKHWDISLPLFCTTTTWNFQKFLSYTFYGGNVVRVLVHFFPLPLILTLHYWWPLAFLILSPLLQIFFFRSPLSFASPPPTFSFSLSFSCSIFQICGHDNNYLFKLNTLDNTDTEKIFAFRFRLWSLLSLLYKTRRRWLYDFLPK